MIKLVRDIFQTIYVFVLIIALIIAIVLGGYIGQSIDSDKGMLLGAVVGFITIVLMFGWSAVLLNIDENMQKIADKIAPSPIPNAKHGYIPGQKIIVECPWCKTKQDVNYVHDDDAAIQCAACGKSFFPPSR